jgi:hypothetical protein
MRTNSRPSEPMDPPHLPANTGLAHPSASAHKQHHQPDHHHLRHYHMPLQVTGSDASKKGTTLEAPPSLVQDWTGFSPRDLVLQDKRCLVVVPSTGRTTLQRRCRMDLPGPTTSVGTRTDYSVGPWDYPACATRHLKAWSTRTTQE